MILKNVNKKALIIATIITSLSVLWYIISPNTSIIILMIVLSIPILVSLLEFFKNVRKGKPKRNSFNIYWKKNLLFLVIFIIVDIFSVMLGNLSFNVQGFPIPYYSQYFQDPSPLFHPAFLIFDILFWYLITGLIIKKPIEMSRTTIRLNRITLIIVSLVLLYSFWGLISNYLTDNLSSDKKKIEECENLSNKQGNDQQYS